MIRVEVIPTSRGQPDIHVRLSPEMAMALKRVVDEKVRELQAPESLARYPAEYVDRVVALAAALGVVTEALQANPPAQVEYPQAPE